MDTESIIRKMSLREKILFCTGADMWHTKSKPEYGTGALTMSDGPHGMRYQGDIDGIAGMNVSAPATCFPAAVTAGATWDEELMYEEGAAIGREAHDLGVDIVLGPGCNIKRNPLCGRNFEYFSEDAYVSGKLAAALVRGVQSEGVAACVKHFCANNQESHRQKSDSQVDMRTLREVYLAPFETVIREGNPDTVMCSYNMINGTYASDNRLLLTDILRREWGFAGLVMSDWGAMSDRRAAFSAGCDLCMPGGSSYMLMQTEQAVRDGSLSENDIDESVRRILRLCDKYAGRDKVTKASFTDHRATAQRVAEEGAVLLKNDGILPLGTKKIRLFGHMCEETRFQGAGSSHINPHTEVHILDAFPGVPYTACCDKYGAVSDEALQSAALEAKECDVAIVVAGLPECMESEGFDREDMCLPDGHNRMIQAIADANPNTVVILSGGGAMELPWEKSVRAILYMGLPGQAAGDALSRILSGEVNPSGKLTETWPYKYSDVNTRDNFGSHTVEYRESIYVGYRYYDTAGVPVRYPFGHGLSYTSFEYKNIRIDGRKVTADITNTGDVDGAEVVQLYIKPPECGIFRPRKELRGFRRIYLSAGETKSVIFELTDRDFSVWAGGWTVPCGTYTVMLASSCADIRLSADIVVDTGEDVPRAVQNSWYFHPTPELPSREEWLGIMDCPVTERTAAKKGGYDMNSTCEEMRKHSFVMRMQYALTKLLVAKRVSGRHDMSNPEYRMMFTSAVECPMRTVVISSCGQVSEPVARGLVKMANGRFFAGICEMMKKY